ncbi:putative phage abortive infection protein [Flavobacterium sp. WW92]|uniref:putative phage abortive infection protein n=1 Tax=unclassified Flavobacterium TaxID=196869 RepID=UPI0022257567|nr:MULTISPECIES: putative phage abortive infection protein [unclassified Flavobacterium]WDO12114.1 putative phage abortive infection protein [Flavobacterium sp. WW92]
MIIFIIFFYSIAVIAFSIGFYYFLKKYKPNLEPYERKSSIIIISIFLLSFSSYLLAVVLNETNYLLINSENIKGDLSKIGPYGDFIGGMMNPVIAFIGIIAASLAFYAQYRANQQVQEQFKIQQFESQFFEMLRLHKENINEMKINGYDVLISNAVETGSGKIVETITRTQIERPVEGRKVFVSMEKEFIACYKFCQLYNSQLTHKYKKDKILKLAYRIFFFSSTSDTIFLNGFSAEFILKVRENLKMIRDEHKKSSGQINLFPGIKKEKISLHIKYSPFTGHESRLGHYYRHLYSTVKYVVKKEKEGLFNYAQSREYLKLLRAQMSNGEQKLLYYNYVIGFGANWDYIGNEGNQFLTHYRMLHNLPVDNIKYVENPRKHFKVFIDSIVDKNDPMFEWGDT